jgi:hypothetical protein
MVARKMLSAAAAALGVALLGMVLGGGCGQGNETKEAEAVSAKVAPPPVAPVKAVALQEDKPASPAPKQLPAARQKRMQEKLERAQAKLQPPVTEPESPPVVRDPAAGVPDMVFASPNIDFGRVKAGEIVDLEFEFSNPGTAPLVIERVKATCGCTVTGEFDQELAPGAQGKIPVRFESKKFKGKLSKALIAFTNVPGKEQIRFSLSGDVWQPIHITPGSAAFGSAKANEAETREITIANNLPEPLELKELRCDNDRFAVTLDAIEAGKLFRVTVTTVPPLTERFTRGIITVTTNVPDIPMIELVASAYVPPPVLVTPSMLRFPSVVAKEMKRYVYVRHSKGRQMKLEDVKVDDDRLDIKVIDDRPEGQAYRIIVTAPEGYTLGEKGALLTFKTDEPEFPIGRVPLQPLPVAPTAGGSRPSAASVPPTGDGDEGADDGHDHSEHAKPGKSGKSGVDKGDGR